MKILLNKDWGGFEFPDAFIERFPQYRDCESSLSMKKRSNPELIAAVEEFGIDNMGDIKIVEMPDNVTDWEMGEDDGMEYITYVVDGKLGHC